MFVLTLLTALAGEPPDGWALAGSAPDAYEVDIVDEAFTGSASARYRSTKSKTGGFGTLMQSILPGEYAGKRIRLSAQVKSEDIESWAGLWLRVDGKGRGSLQFDNMRDRPIEGTTSWNRYEIVLDVPEEATNVAFGILVSGAGTVWMDDLEIEIVSDSTPKTGIDNTKSGTVVNGSFETP